MSATSPRDLLPNLATRQGYIDYLEGFSTDRSEDMQRWQVKRPLVKSFLFETVRNSEPHGGDLAILRQSGLQLDQIDESLFKACPQGETGTWGLLELLVPRHPVLYSTLPSNEMNKWGQKIIHSSPALDRVWLSSVIFQELWGHVRSTTPASRFSRITFEHEARYETEDMFPSLQSRPTAQTDSATGMDDDQEDENEEDQESEDDQSPARERRSSRFTFVERIGTMEAKLGSLRNVHPPFWSIVQLRMPGAIRGGHDFYFDGRVTNKSDSFAEHRATLAFVLSLYRNSTESAEDSLWMSTESFDGTGVDQYRLHGAPVVMKFSESLSEKVFSRWMARLVQKQGRFRIWGNPIQVASKQFHVYGVDRHLWQPVYLEITPAHLIAILPKGTCGNTVHRLVSNIQRFVDPAVETWIGDQTYASVVEQARGSSEQRPVL